MPNPETGGPPDGRDEPSASPHDRGHEGPQSVPGDTRSLRPRGREFEPPFWPVSGPPEPGGCTGLSGAPRVARQCLVDGESNGVCAALLLRRDAGPREDAATPCLRPRTEQAPGRT